MGSVQGVTESDTTKQLTLSPFNFPVLAATHTDGNDYSTEGRRSWSNLQPIFLDIFKHVSFDFHSGNSVRWSQCNRFQQPHIGPWKLVFIDVFRSACQVTSVTSNSLQPYELQPTKLFCHGILQARNHTQWVAMPFSRGSSHPGIELAFLRSPALTGTFLLLTQPRNSGCIYRYEQILQTFFSLQSLLLNIYQNTPVQITQKTKLFGVLNNG